MTNTLRLGAFLIVVLADVNVALGAANASWTGLGSSSRWLDADNWSASEGATLPPYGNTDVYFNNVANKDVLFDSATELNWKVQFHNGIDDPIVFTASEPSYGLSLLDSSYGIFRVAMIVTTATSRSRAASTAQPGKCISLTVPARASSRSQAEHSRRKTIF